jgi:tRNA (guanine37-N1)-methyltransferase
MDARAFIKALLAAPENRDVDVEREWMATKATYDANIAKYLAKKQNAKVNKIAFREPRPKLTWAANDDDGEPPAGATFDHLITNLPASGIEFLDCLKGSFDRGVWEHRDLPMIHCYTFKGANETDADVIKRGAGHLGAEIVDATVSEVRDVSPNKLMVLLSFRISEEAAYPNDAKRLCTTRDE